MRAPGLRRALVLTLVGAGLAAGPGYYAYCTALSGSIVAEHELRAEGKAFAPVTMRLSPVMNPISFVASAWISGSPPAEAAYRLTIEDRGALVYTDLVRFTIEKDQDSGNRQARVLDRFEVTRDDDYVVRFTPGNRAALRLDQPSLAVRGNVRVPDMRIVGWGLFFLALGALIAWLSPRPTR